MKLRSSKTREPRILAKTVLREADPAPEPEKPRLSPELKKTAEKISPFSHGEKAEIASMILPLLPEQSMLRSIIHNLAKQVVDLATGDDESPEDLNTHNDQEAADTLLSLGLLKDLLPQQEIQQVARKIWGKIRFDYLQRRDLLRIAIGGLILLPEKKTEIDRLTSEFFQDFDPNSVVGAKDKPLFPNGLVTRALVKLLKPELTDRLALTEDEVKKITRQLPGLQLDRDGEAAKAIFGVAILTHPDVHLVPGVGLDFHPVKKAFSRSEQLPERSVYEG